MTRQNTLRIRAYMRHGLAMTRRELAETLQLENGEVAARVNELLKCGFLIEKGYKLSPITKRAVNVIRIARKV